LQKKEILSKLLPKTQNRQRNDLVSLILFFKKSREEFTDLKKITYCKIRRYSSSKRKDHLRNKRVRVRVSALGIPSIDFAI